jgi:hypothetical protein
LQAGIYPHGRAYEKTLEVQDLLGNRIILLKIQRQAPLASHHSDAFSQYFEINPFENNETHFAGKTYDNLSFKCQPEKVLFADGSKVEASH